jgi:hypothetical protein
MIVISDIPGKDPWSASSRDIRVFTEMARLHGHRVFEVPSNFADCGGVERAFAYVPRIEGRELCVLNGFIPSNERYQEIFEAAAARNLQVINSLDEFRRALEFDKSYPLIEDLTARSVIVQDLDEAEARDFGLGAALVCEGQRAVLEAVWD